MDYQSFELKNGLKVIVHEDHSTKQAVLNLLYQVGSRDESEEKTGFAHLFEHLMFGGSKNIESYDEPLQTVGGENNAFTSPDLTNYYITIPSNNLETAFWLESDRMLSLSFNPEVLEVQRKVVIEEFKQRYLDQPYGDAWLKLRPLAYKEHPYKWATIGKEISHIEDATMDDVIAFFKKHYIPNNAILVVAGDVTLEQIKALSEKWFEPIPVGTLQERNLPKEPKQLEARKLELEADVPLNAIYKVYHMPDRLSSDYFAADLMGDVLGRGKSSRLYEKLVKSKNLMTSVNVYITGSIDAGLLVITGKLNEGVSFETFEAALDIEIEEIISNPISDEELEKVKNQAESAHIFSEMELLNKAYSLAYFTMLGDTSLINEEVNEIRAVEAIDIQKSAKRLLLKENCSTLYYKKKTAVFND